MKLKYQIPVLVLIISSIPFLRLASQDVGIGTTTPDYRLHISSADSTLLKLENSTGLNTNIRASLFFKTGTKYTGAIKTIGTGSNSARFGFFTYAVASPTLLKERISILDNGYVGIDNINPDFKLDVRNGSINTDSVYRIGTSTILAIPGTGNLFIGKEAGKNLAGGTYNTFQGDNAGYSITTGHWNIFSGRRAGYGTKNGLGNTFIGTFSGEDNESGNFNSTLGYNAEANGINRNNSTAIGAFARVDCDNCMVLGSVNGINQGTANVNVGIGTTNPTRPLSFPAQLGKKISLYPGATGDAGFGVFGNELRLHSDNPSADITFGYDVFPSTYVERMRIKGNGNVGIGTNAPVYMLDVNGRMRIKHNVNSSGIWLANSTNTDDVGFVGLMNDTHVGLYGDNSAGWGLVMNTVNGNVGIGTTSPDYQLEVEGNGPTIGLFDNTSTGVAYGLAGYALNSPTGVGVKGEGKSYGVLGIATISGTGDRNGVYGGAANGAGTNYGLYGTAVGGNIAYGIYATASGGTTNWAGYFAGNVYSTGTYQGSDRKLKVGIEPIKHAIDLINLLKPTSYMFRTKEYEQMQLPEGTQYGLIADEVKQILPGVVKKTIQPAQFENINEVNSRKISDAVEFEAINYTQMIPILIGAVQEQQKQIVHQQQQIDELKKLVLELGAKK